MKIEVLETGAIKSDDSYINTETFFSSGKEQFVAVIPAFYSGEYYITGTDRSGTEIYFALTVHRVGPGYSITYGKEDDISLDELKVANDGSIHILVRKSDRLYYQFNASGLVLKDDEHFIATYDEYPLTEYAFTYKCAKKYVVAYSTWEGIDVIETAQTDIGKNKLSLSAVDEASKASPFIEWDPYAGSNKTFLIYKPNQTLNTDSSVKFSSVTIEAKDGTFIKSENGKLVGVDMRLEFVVYDDFKKAVDALKDTDDQLRKSIVDNISNINTRITNLSKDITASIEATSESARKYTDGEVAKEAAIRLANDNANSAAITNLSSIVSSNKTTLENAITTEIGNREIEDSKLETSINEVVKALNDYKSIIDKAVEVLSKRLDDIESNYVTTDTEQTITGKKNVTGGMVFTDVAPVIPTVTPSNANVAGALYYV